MRRATKYKRISVLEARTLLRNRQVAIFDMRDEKAFAEGHISGARRVSDANLGEMMLGLPKDRSILIYCYRGKGSLTYAQTFVDFGFTDVYSMDGGFNAWTANVPEAQGAA